MKEIKEFDALRTLMQMHQSQMSMIYGAVIAAFIGLFAIPLFAFNSSVSLCPQAFGLAERLICFIITLLLGLAAVYAAIRAAFLGALSWETLIRLGVKDKGKSLMEYYNEMKLEVQKKYPVFKKFRVTPVEHTTLKHSYKRQVRIFIILAMVLLFFLFSFVWWKFSHSLWCVFGSEFIYGLLIWLLLRFIPIM